MRQGVSANDAARALRSAARCSFAEPGIRLACRVLARSGPRAAVRALLSTGLRELGPEGGTFEQFVARVLARLGFETEVRATREGRCVRHEIDVLARRPGHTLLCECKLRTRAAARIELPVVLAAYGRAADLGALGDGPTRACLVTNARFTDDARAFATGMGLRLCGWEHPEGQDFRAWVEAAGTFPVTALPHLPPTAARALIQAGICDTDSLLEQPEALAASGVLPGRAARILTEARAARSSGLPRSRSVPGRQPSAARAARISPSDGKRSP